MKCALFDLIATGTIGGVTTGSTPADVRARFGEPDDESIQREPRIWKYGAFEVTFRSGIVELLVVELFQDLPKFIGADGLSAATTRAEVERLLRGRGIAYQPYPPLTAEHDQSALKTGTGGAVVIFDEDARINSISVIDRLR